MARPGPAKIRLRFDPASDRLRSGKQLREGLSGVAGLLDTLWVASDETLSVERLDRVRGRGPTFGAHTTFALNGYLGLPDGVRDEADVEDLDISGGYLWIVGSHAAEREMPGAKASPRKIAKTLAKVARQGNRCLLARIPIVPAKGTWTLERRTGRGARKRRAARLEGSAKGNALIRALRRDEHFGGTLAPPGKENGFDVEGLAVIGRRVLLGMRGPVFNQWAAILEIEPRPMRNRPELLRLAPIGRGKRLYRKHFLKLDGLGIRALCRQGADLLVLAGPMAALHGPVKLYRWIGGARSDVERRMRPADLVHVMDLRTGQGNDYPEGIVVVPSSDGRDRLLVVYERASRERFRDAHDVDADLFVIPQ
jgi:uncharacterized protein DUF3616